MLVRNKVDTVIFLEPHRIRVKKKPKSKEPSAKRAKVGKGEKVKDPNMPKRPPNIQSLFVILTLKKH
ncbi:hypothetical protein P8452_43046 [Trifolium repens]|nr:hypothetical protein P8452_43046 [Trifolium repens]